MAQSFFAYVRRNSTTEKSAHIRIVTSSVGTKGAGRCVGRLFACLRFVVSHFTALPLGAGGGQRSLIVTLPGDLFKFLFCQFRWFQYVFSLMLVVHTH